MKKHRKGLVAGLVCCGVLLLAGCAPQPPSANVSEPPEPSAKVSESPVPSENVSEPPAPTQLPWEAQGDVTGDGQEDRVEFTFSMEGKDYSTAKAMISVNGGETVPFSQLDYSFYELAELKLLDLDGDGVQEPLVFWNELDQLHFQGVDYHNGAWREFFFPGKALQGFSAALETGGTILVTFPDGYTQTFEANHEDGTDVFFDAELVPYGEWTNLGCLVAAPYTSDASAGGDRLRVLLLLDLYAATDSNGDGSAHAGLCSVPGWVSLQDGEIVVDCDDAILSPYRYR